MEARHVTRRSFLLGLNLSLGGLALGFFPGAALALENSVQRIRSTFDPNVFIHVSESGEVTIVCHRSEMGQGIRSSPPCC